MKIALDLDDVIVDLKPEIKRTHPLWCGTTYAIPNFDVYKLEYQDVGVNDIPTFDFECYITARGSYLRNVTDTWLAKHNLNHKPVYYGNNKLQIMRRLGIDVLIDDKPNTFHRVNASEKICYLYTQPWNVHIKTNLRVNNLLEFKEILCQNMI